MTKLIPYKQQKPWEYFQTVEPQANSDGVKY
jgi:hypothetical protein